MVGPGNLKASTMNFESGIKIYSTSNETLEPDTFNSYIFFVVTPGYRNLPGLYRDREQDCLY